MTIYFFRRTSTHTFLEGLIERYNKNKAIPQKIPRMSLYKKA